MAAGDIKRSRGTVTALTLTAASLAASSTLVAGRESTSVTRSTATNPIDILIACSVTTGTSPTAGFIEVWVICKNDDEWPDVFDGTDSAETVTTRAKLESYGRLLWRQDTDATSNGVYDSGELSMAALFDDNLPVEFALFLVHSTVAALHATGGNHEFYYVPEFLNVAAA